MKKILVLLLAMVMVLSLAACGDDDNDKDKSEGSQKNTYETPLELMTDWDNENDVDRLIENEYKLLNGFCEKEYKALLKILEKSDLYKEYIDEYKDDVQEYIQEKKYEYGSDYKYAFKVEEKVKLEDADLKELEDDIDAYVDELEFSVENTKDYDSDDWEDLAYEFGCSKEEVKNLIDALEDFCKTMKSVNVEDGYELTVTVILKGSNLEEPEEVERTICVYKVDGRWISTDALWLISDMTDFVFDGP